MRLTPICYITLMSAALAAPRPQWLALPSESRNICARAADLQPPEPRPRRQSRFQLKVGQEGTLDC